MSAPLTRMLDRGSTLFFLLLVAIGVAVPLLNLFVPPSSPFHVPIYLVALFGKYLCYALLALSIDLIWGYCGILSLGHGAFFALGGYAMGMYLMRQIGTRGVYAHPILPDFMVFLNWKELPWFWYGFDMFWFAALMVVAVPGVLAFVFGWFAFRSRVTGVYLSIITQALTFALMLGFFRNNFGFGGNNGLTDFKDILGFNVQAQGTRIALFAISCGAVALGFLICRAIITSKLGKVLIAIRDAESRTRFLGYRVESYKLFVFTLSACMAGVAGALYVPQVGIINPSEFNPANSIEAVIWVAVGGRGTLTGAVLGAVVVNYAKTTFTSGALAPYFLFGIGVAAVLVWASIRSRAEALIGAALGAAAAAAGALLLPGTGIPALLVLAAHWSLAVAGIFGVIWILSERWWALGGLLGALLFLVARTPFETIALAPYWLFLLGGLFVAVTLLLPRGIVGTWQHWRASRRKSAGDPSENGSAAPVPEPQPAE